MSRLLTLLLLYRSGYMVGQYISIEKAIAGTKESYYKALADADKLWHEEKNDPKPFIKYMLGVILASYREFEARVTIAEKSWGRSTSYDIVKEFVLNKIGTFTKQEAMMACPSLGSPKKTGRGWNPYTIGSRKKNALCPIGCCHLK